MTEERTHSHLGGSSAERWLACPGSIALIEKCPKQETSQAALDGTEAHEFVEKAVRAFLTYKESGKWTCKEDFSDIVTGENAEELLPVVQEAVKTVWEKVLMMSITNKAYGLEDDFSISDELEMSGYVDFWCIYKDAKGKRVGVIFDFKYGYGYVNEKNNAQLAFYACALRRFVKENGKDLDYVRTAIYQPRNGGAEKEFYRESKISAKRLDKWDTTFKKVGGIIRNHGENALPVKAGEHCRYCPAKAVCSAHVRGLQKETNLLLTTEDAKEHLPIPLEMSDTQVFNVVANADKIEDFISACKAYVINRHQDNKPVVGLKVVESTPRRKWAEDVSIDSVLAFGKTVGVPADAIVSTKLNALTQVEKKIADPTAKEVFKQFIGYTTPKPTIVLDSDARPALGTTTNLLKDE